MRYGKEEIYQLLETEKILFEKVEHPAVYTIDGMKDLHLPNEEAVAKNLFVRDKKKKQYYLIVLREDKHCDLKALQEKVGYPGLAEHKVKHDDFRQTVKELHEMLEEMEGPTDAFVEAVNKNVIMWLYGHIKGFDCSIATYINMKAQEELL